MQDVVARTHPRIGAAGITAMLALAITMAACGDAHPVRSVELFVVRIEVKTDDIYVADAKTGPWTTLATPNARVTLLDSSAEQIQAASQLVVPAQGHASYRVTIDPTRSLLTLGNGSVLRGTRESSGAALTPDAVRTELSRIAAGSRPPAPDVRVEYIVQRAGEKLPER